MAKILVHITHGPEHPTRVALGLLVAKTAVEEGHDVGIFLAGDAVAFVRPKIAENAIGVGTGKVSEHLAAARDGGARFFVSKMSCAARGIGEEDVAELGAQMATPNMLVALSLEHDRMFNY